MLIALLCILSALATPWQQPDDDILGVLHAPDLPWVWTAPDGEHLLLADGVYYPPLAELAAPMHELAGVRVSPTIHGHYNRQGATSPRLLRVEDGTETDLPIPEGAQVMGVKWTADGERFALQVKHPDHLGLWVGSVGGSLDEIEGLALNPILGSEWTWMPDQQRLLVKAVPDDLGAEPPAPAIPVGPEVRAAAGETARSTYEARNLLETAHDEALFEHYATSQVLLVDPDKERLTPLGEPDVYTGVSPSPSGRFVLVERLVPPWSHETGYWRFAHEVEVWNRKGRLVATVASNPLADAVPVHGVPTGPRWHGWRATDPHTLVWTEALDGGDPVAEAEHRDRVLRLERPFTGEPDEVFRAEHRVRGWSWTEGGQMVLRQRERERRWKHVWLVDVDAGTGRPWYDLSEKERYADPGRPVRRPLDNGRLVLHQQGDAVYFAGPGATPEGDRPFLDLRHLETGATEHLFRSSPERYEHFVAFAGGEDRFLFRRESATEVPNFHLATLGDPVEASEGEAARTYAARPVTDFEDPAPQLRQIEKRIVRYEREDGVPLSFHLYLPPGYEEGSGPLPTVLYAYPLEYSDAGTAGQVRGSAQRFLRLYGSSHRFFLLEGYAVLDRTAMPMIGDPETTYDTFVPQLVADAEAAVDKAVELGVADPERIGVVGHSHGGLMVANLLAHTDLFTAGIARSGSYNKTVQPFGYQSERRSLFEAREAYIAASPTFFADQIDEPILLVHGAEDSNPGTLTPQSEVLYEAVRGSGGTTRLVILPHEDHGYRARESVEHVLWEQHEWFDRYVGAPR